MLRNALIPALFTVLALQTASGTDAASAAELSNAHRTYIQTRDRALNDDNFHTGDYAPRKVYSESTTRDDDRWEGRRWHHRRWQHRQIERIEARASYAGDYMPYYIKEWRAKRSAIDVWKSKAAIRYGEDFAHWRSAEDKRIDCEAGGGSVYCSVSARPQRGWSHWSQNRDRDYR